MKVTTLKVDDFAKPYYCETGNIDIIVGNIYIFKTNFGLESGKVLRQPFDIKKQKKTGDISPEIEKLRDLQGTIKQDTEKLHQNADALDNVELKTEFYKKYMSFARTKCIPHLSETARYAASSPGWAIGSGD